MKTIAALLLILSLSGCASFAKPEAVIGCQAADTVTTIAALHNGATEANPIVAGIIKSAGYFGLIVFKIATTLLLLSYADEQPEAVGFASAITCGAAANNILLL